MIKFIDGEPLEAAGSGSGAAVTAVSSGDAQAVERRFPLPPSPSPLSHTSALPGAFLDPEWRLIFVADVVEARVYSEVASGVAGE